jgi:HTH-type transcriptional regulator/antitoxin HigA
MKLIRRFPLRPVRTEDELERAIAVSDTLVVRLDGLALEGRDYLDILSGIVEK